MSHVRVWRSHASYELTGAREHVSFDNFRVWADVLGVLPNGSAVRRPIGAGLAQQHDDLFVGRRGLNYIKTGT